MSLMPVRLDGSFQNSSITAHESGEVRDRFPLHWHNFYELELAVEGRGRHIVNGRSSGIEEGCLYLLTPTDLHEIVAHEPMSFLNVKIDAQAVSGDLRALIYSQTRCAMARFTGGEYTALLLDFRRILWEDRHSEPGRDTVMGALVQKILVDLFRKTAADADDGPGGEGPALQKIRRSIIYINHNYTGAVTLGDAAALSGYSPNYFSHLFAEVTGTTFQDYVTGLRMGFAKSLLAGTGLPVSEVGCASGFESLSHFLRTFKKQCGVTPSRYRKNHGAA